MICRFRERFDRRLWQQRASEVRVQDGPRGVDDSTEFRIPLSLNSLDQSREDGRFIQIGRRGGPSILNGRSQLFEDDAALSRHILATEGFQ